MRLHVGTSGYNFPEWKGTFYPEKIKPANMLAYYAGRLSTVEINYTFYRMPNAKTVSGWSQAVPDGFTFVLKTPQRITHIARLKNIDDSLRYFTETVRPPGCQARPDSGAAAAELQTGPRAAQGFPHPLSRRPALRVQVSQRDVVHR
jgi:uncharacterized protein YecE (DUF72 family)